jgi:hypothetical protein
MPKIPVTINCGIKKGEFEGWRHTIGHGGVNRYPLPVKIQRGLAALKPRLVRTFIQEYFNVYPDHDAYDWSRLDPYMDSLAASGGKVVACICIKPPVLYPVIDEQVIMPNDIEEWQRLIGAMVKRYSVDKEMVTYWEIANESDIGEWGGCPYLTRNAGEYNEYYKITQEAVLRTFPKAKVGGLGLANAGSPLMEGLLAYCSSGGLQLDFISWHLYSDDPQAHAVNVVKIRELAHRYYPQDPPEMLITEMGKGFDDVCVEESAFDNFRPAVAAAVIFNLLDTKVDWTFYYHIWDQVFVADQFRPFYKKPDIMLHHWNKVPHRMGMFGVCGELRPTYFVYRMLAGMKGDEIVVESGAGDLRVKAVMEGKGACRVMLVNYDTRQSRDLVAELDMIALPDGLKLLTSYKIDGNRLWDEKNLELRPVERRYVDISKQDSERLFFCNIFCPANSVTMVCIEPVTEAEMLQDYNQMQ